MKRFVVILLSAALVMTMAACTGTKENTEKSSAVSSEAAAAPAAELPEGWKPLSIEAETVPLENDPAMEALSGEWYGIAEGVVICMNLNADGTYVLSVPGLAEERLEGSWNYEKGQLFLDGDTNQEVLVTDSSLYWPELDLDMTREKQEIYSPGEPLTDVQEADFTGYWVSLYAEVDGSILPAHILEDDTDLYLEGKWAALGGSLFGDIAREFTLKDGAMTYDNGEISIALQFLNDGMLRLKASLAEGEMTLYMTPQSGASELSEQTEGWVADE